jgi:diguanylate cyclase (GGDEF)-like protein
VKVKRLRPNGFLVAFGLACVVPVAVTAAGLTHFLSDQIRSRALESQRAAAVLAASSIQSSLSPYDVEYGLTPAAFVAVDGTLVGLRTAGVEHVQIARADGKVIYSDRRSEVGRETTLRAAGDGTRVTSRFVQQAGESGSGSDSFAVVVPLRFPDESAVRGTVQLTIPYAPIRKGIDHTIRLTNLILLGALALLYAALFPIAYKTSRRLRRQAEENRQLALHDHLTALPNRALFLDRAEHALQHARREREQATVLLMDVDRFKEINDSLGHQSGDLVLQQVASRLRDIFGEKDTLARLGGDEFAVVIPGASADESQFAVDRIIATLEQPCLVRGLPLQIEMSIGMASYPEHGDGVETLVRNADIAMYVAKRSSSHHAVYLPEQDVYSPARVALISELRRAINERELVLHYQPKLNLRDGSVTGVEALVRWRHPTRGLLAPREFIPLAQHTSLIDPLTQYILRAAIARIRAWLDAGLHIGVAVNISTRNLIDPAFPASVRRLLADYGVAADLLELEITESSVFTDPKRAAETLAALHDLGIKLSVDDFGTGYSSLSSLVQLPVDQIKIDRSFVASMDSDSQCAALVHSTIELAKKLSLETVAEGVEDAEMMTTLAELGCDAVQGYCVSRPLPAEEATRWLLARREARLRLIA